MSVTDLRELLDDLARAAPPPTRSTAETTYAEGRRRWRRRRAVTATLATVLAAVTAGGIGVAAAGLPTASGPVAPGASTGTGAPTRTGVIQWIGAGDARHLYVAHHACPPGACPKTRVRLIGSDDGGRTWTERTPAMDAYHLVVLGPETLVDQRPLPQPSRLSVDGGRTWRPLTPTKTTAPAAPAGGGLVCLGMNLQVGCRIHAVDPVAGTASPLLAPPGLTPDPVPPTTVGGATWVGGMGDGWPTVAVSRDGGRIWSTFPLTDTGTRRDEWYTTTEVTTVDGYTVHVVATDAAAKRRVVFRGTAAGGFRRIVGAEKVAYSQVGGPSSFVLADGTHVLYQMVADRPDRDRVRFWAGDGRVYRPTTFDGLPDTVYPIRRTPDGWYYTRGYGGDGSDVYGSADGRHWAPVTVP